MEEAAALERLPEIIWSFLLNGLVGGVVPSGYCFAAYHGHSFPHECGSGVQKVTDPPVKNTEGMACAS